MVNPLMTHTLPTIIGAGVASRATETMFGKGKGRRRTTNTIGKGKRFNGKVYKPANWHPTKASAERDATYFRKAGHNARVVREYNTRLKKWGYMVYVQ